MPETQFDPGSFRDPNGRVFRVGDRIFRSFKPPVKDLLTNDSWLNFTQKMVAKKQLVKFDVQGEVIEMDKIPFISYPYEWCPEQLKQAALLTLEIQRQAIEAGWSLKDASAFNVQFIGANPIFIDHLSFEPFKTEPWVGYRQFCEHFFAPLVLASHVDPLLASQLWNSVNGVDLSVASRVLGKRGKWNLAINLHIHQLGKKVHSGGARRTIKQSKNAQFAIIEQLYNSIRGLTFNLKSDAWDEYYETCNYSRKAEQHKTQIVTSILKEVSPSTLIDLGSNTGKYSQIASELGAYTVASEFELSVVNELYLRNKSASNLLPLCIDLCSPTASRGWNLTERKDFYSRIEFDCALALAIIHHLVFHGQIPLEKVIQMIASFGQNAIIEWVEPSDTYAQRLIAERTLGMQPYSRDLFEKSLKVHFEIISIHEIVETERALYFVKKVAI
jgi:hypothetical protein